ncbi:MAG: glucose-6-phosphate dehydrogenase [Candidatus Hydrogenedentes bacterium]|nr:glucose-6-phosphate dehydrogenase [Candidatus Hydrogenedentota bacterium]
MSKTTSADRPLVIILLGASGDLALKKVIPALFALYSRRLLRERVRFVGYARSPMTTEAFRERIMAHLTCRYVPGEKCDDWISRFLDRCTYVSGQYDSPDDLRRLQEIVRPSDADTPVDRIFYMAIPPFLFLDVAQSLAGAGLVTGSAESGWSRVVIEKPFGRDRASSDELTRNMTRVFTEEQTYRIDHYLGKEVIQNLLVLRFANLIFDPIWNRAHIEQVKISWMEDIGLEGRAGYFDDYGIIRDVMQNHLLQILALVAMEQPVRLEAGYVRDEKVKALRCVQPVTVEDLVTGQYTAGALEGRRRLGYLEEEGIPAGSVTPTYAAAALHVRNRRWDGVPFLIRAGKALNARMTEIRIRFRPVPGNIFLHAAGHLANNELIIRVQPDAAITFRIVNKVPGLGITLEESDLDLQYASAFPVQIPDAYECLLLDVIEGDRSLFIRADELAAAWDIFTPVLHELATRGTKPRPYSFGSAGPEAAQALAARYGATW